MIHYFKGEIKKIWSEYFLTNDLFWIQVAYSGNQKEGSFFIYPYFDDQRKTFGYFAFDSFEQKQSFESLLKISWVGTKTAFQIVQFPSTEIKDAVDNLDAKFFQSIPWIWPKLAKKIVIELKWNFQIAEVFDVEQDQKLFKSVAKSLQNFWFDGNRVKELLRNYPEKLTEKNLPEVAKRVIAEMSK